MGFKYETWKGKYKRNNSPFCQMPGTWTTTETWHDLKKKKKNEKKKIDMTWHNF